MGLEHGQTLLRRVLVVVGAAVLLAVVPFVSGLLGGLMLFAISRPVHTWLSRILPRRLSAFAICLAVFVLLVVPGVWLVSTMIAELSSAVQSWERDGTLERILHTPLGRFDVAKTIANVGSNLLAWLSGRAVALFGNVTTTTLNLFVALFGLYYLLVDGASLWSRVKRLTSVPHRILDHLAERFVSVTEGLLLGTALTALLQGIVVGSGFALVGITSPVLWGFVTACASVLPLFGSALVWFPGVVVLLIADRTGAAIALGALGAGVASNIDNVARLLVYRRISGIHPMVTLVGAFAGIRLFGIIGALVGPLILSYLLELITLYESARGAADVSAPFVAAKAEPAAAALEVGG